MAYKSTKTYGHDVGLSCAFRQWKAESHCHYIHGYALAITVTFGCVALDDHNWVIDFGGLKDFKATLQDTFDHKLLVAQDDPQIHWYKEALRKGIADVVVVHSVGCEAFAKIAFDFADQWLKAHGHSTRCNVVSVEVREHGANSAIYTGG